MAMNIMMIAWMHVENSSISADILLDYEDILLDYEMETALIEELTNRVPYIKVTFILYLPTSVRTVLTHSVLTRDFRSRAVPRASRGQGPTDSPQSAGRLPSDPKRQSLISGSSVLLLVMGRVVLRSGGTALRSPPVRHAD